MQTSELKNTILEIFDIVAPGCLPPVIDEQADLREEFDLDSMDLLNVDVAVHERLGVDISDADLVQMHTLTDIVGYIGKNL